MNLTTRERRTLFIASFIVAVIFIASLINPWKVNRFLSDWEWVFLFFVVGPLGLYIASDPERRKEG